MNENILSLVHEENSFNHNACWQTIKWNTKNISGSENANGFIVQQVEMTNIVNGTTNLYRHYFEAWKVINDKCEQDSVLPFDDCVGCFTPFFEDKIAIGNSIEASIYKSGSFSAILDVYWVDINTPLYDDVSKWKKGIGEASGAPSIEHSPELEDRFFNNCSHFKRKPFIHNWNFTDRETIFEDIYSFWEKYFCKENPNADFIYFVYNNLENNEIKTWLIEKWNSLYSK